MTLGTHVLPSIGALMEQSLAHVGPRARGAMAGALIPVVVADSVRGAQAALSRMGHGPLGARYPAVVATWEDALPRLEPLYALPRKLRNITLLGDSAAQGLRRSLARSIRRHGSFPSREAAVSFIWGALGRAKLALDLADSWDREDPPRALSRSAVRRPAPLEHA